MFQELFGNKVKQLRMQKGISQYELSIVYGIDRPKKQKLIK